MYVGLVWGFGNLIGYWVCVISFVVYFLGNIIIKEIVVSRVRVLVGD